MVFLTKFPKTWEIDFWKEKSGKESRPLRPQQCWDRIKYSEGSWKPEENCCRTDSPKDQRLMLAWKLIGSKIIIIVIIIMKEICTGGV